MITSIDAERTQHNLTFFDGKHTQTKNRTKFPQLNKDHLRKTYS